MLNILTKKYRVDIGELEWVGADGAAVALEVKMRNN